MLKRQAIEFSDCNCALCDIRNTGKPRTFARFIKSYWLHFVGDLISNRNLWWIYRPLCAINKHVLPVCLMTTDGAPVVCAICGKTLNYSEPIYEWGVRDDKSD